MTKKSIKQQSLEHYQRMIDYAKTLDPDAHIKCSTFESECGEIWDSEYCAYCKAIADFGCCYIDPCETCSLDSFQGCCGGNWEKINNSLNNAELVKALKNVQNYIKKYGTENGFREDKNE